MVEEDRAIRCQNVMSRIDWKKRRMNPVLKFMENQGLIFELSGAYYEELLGSYFRLTDEADFYVEQ